MTVVLLHGFGAFMHLLASRSLKPMINALSESGHRVHAPMVQPYDTIPNRAGRWMEHLAHIRTTESAGIHLIAFSSGGLDARYLISRLGGHECVTSLTTVSTPHHGSSLADYIVECPALTRRAVAGLADWMGGRIYRSGPSHALRALEEMTTSHMTGIFNPETPDHPDVAYSSWAGRAGKGTHVPILPALRIPNHIVFKREGPNDGIVSVSSATWTGFRGTVDADHARQIGIQAFNGTFDAPAFLASLVDELRNVTSWG